MRRAVMILALLPSAAIAVTGTHAPPPVLADPARHTVGVNVDLWIDGKPLGNSHVTADLARPAEFMKPEQGTGVSYLVDVQAEKFQNNQVTLSFKVNRVKDGIKTLISSPKLSALLGDTSSIESKDSSGHGVKLVVRTDK